MNIAPTILLVEDNAVDVMLMQRAFRQLAFGYRLTVVEDGALAMQYLNGEGLYADRKEYPFPSLILLDLGLPVVDGFQFLQWLRGTIGFRHVPVIVLSGSSLSTDVKRAYAAGANSFLTKAPGLAELTVEVKGLTDYWLGFSRLPDVGAAVAQSIMEVPHGEVVELSSAPKASPRA